MVSFSGQPKQERRQLPVGKKQRKGSVGESRQQRSSSLLCVPPYPAGRKTARLMLLLGSWAISISHIPASHHCAGNCASSDTHTPQGGEIHDSKPLDGVWSGVGNVTSSWDCFASHHEADEGAFNPLLIRGIQSQISSGPCVVRL